MELKDLNDSVLFAIGDKQYLINKKTLKEDSQILDQFLLQFPIKNTYVLQELGLNITEKNLLLKKVSLYDSSSKVNSFIYKDKELWFDKNTRASLLNAINYSKDTFTFLFGEEEVEMSTTNAKKFIGNLEIYAQKCFLNTQKHLRNISNIAEPTNAEEAASYLEFLKNYDYTTGYPEKIIL